MFSPGTHQSEFIQGTKEGSEASSIVFAVSIYFFIFIFGSEKTVMWTLF